MFRYLQKKYNVFSDWMNYNPPGAMSGTGWRLFRKEFEEKAPIRYFIRHTLWKKVVWPIKYRLRRITEWFVYRFIDKYHVLDTGLKPGYHSIDEQILHVNFNLLKDFVEIEVGWKYLCFHPEEDPNRENFFYRHFRMVRRWKNVNSRWTEFGIKHFKWETTLDDPSLPPHEQSIEQAQTAREVLALYNWWTVQRPSRKNVEITQYDHQGLGTLAILDATFNRTAADYIKHKEDMDRQAELEKEWDEEDTEMLVRLMKIRRSLWS